MNGIIKIKDLRIHCIVGAHAHERDKDQELLIDLQMQLNMSESVQTDSIVDTVDYDAVCQVCIELAKTRRYHLIETFAYEALHAVLDSFPLTWVKICVKKPNAHSLAKYICFELEMEK